MARGGIAATAVAVALIATTGGAAGSVDAPVRADGSTPLQWAAFEGDVTEAQRLIKAGADVHETNSYGVNAMQLAADSANTELIALLLKSGADPESPNADGETAHAVSVPDEAPIDETWSEPVAFDGCSTAGQSRPGQPQPIALVRKPNPAAATGART